MDLLALILGAVMSGSTIVEYGKQPLDYGLADKVSAQQIEHRGFSSEDNRQLMVDYAYKIGGLDFVLMIECENGNRNPYAVSKTRDYGICQLNYKYNKRFIDSDEYQNVYRQLDYCYDKFKINPKLRYGPTRKINGQYCKDYVKGRFILT